MNANIWGFYLLALPCETFLALRSILRPRLRRRARVDNVGCNNATRVMFDSVRKQGTLLEVIQILTDLDLTIKKAYISSDGQWSMAGFPIQDGFKIDMIETQLRNVLKGDNDIRSVKTLVSLKVTHTERRLHQMMFADRDYEQKPIIRTNWDSPIVLIQNCLERGYSGTNVYYEDRARLLFDVVCTLTDMDYVVFHATLKTTRDRAHMEFFVRHKNGLPISSQAEKQFVSLPLKEEYLRRQTSIISRNDETFREYSLNVARAEISTTCDIARNSFYVTDVVGNAADTKMIESVRHKIELSNLRVKELPSINHYKAERKDDPTSTIISGAFLTSLGNLVTRNSSGAFLISLGNLVTRDLRYLGSLIRSYSGTIKRIIVLA
ncbi:ACT domain-containing protein [Heracleum sosnowskyi]|uniref:ACT domain-containing protein ACR n=1 Tax=Heracleum sosnowskyi TaxID=360622 RepID=A0AAD8HJ60_9APIA|nr:ACT domain-containing protein [Heracleum sosnowskyi]